MTTNSGRINVEKVAMVLAVSAVLYMTVPVALGVAFPAALVPLPLPVTCAVLLVGFASFVRLVEAAVVKGKTLAAAVSGVAAAAFGVLVFITLTYCPGGRG